MTYLEVARAVLESATAPLKAGQVWDIAVEKGLDKNLANANRQTVKTIYDRLWRDMRDKQDSIFMKASTNPTTFWLKARENELQKGLESIMQTNKTDYEKQKRQRLSRAGFAPAVCAVCKRLF